MSDPPPEIDVNSTTKSARIEVRFVLWGVIGLIVLGGLYVAIAGSPTKDRAAIDSSNSLPAPVLIRHPANATPSGNQRH
jgi:hypothetical protein